MKAIRQLFPVRAISGVSTTRSERFQLQDERSFVFLRLKYVNDSGSGNIAAYLRGDTITVQWTGTLSGTITVQVSNNPSPPASSDTGWAELVLDVEISQPDGSAGADYIDLRI